MTASRFYPHFTADHSGPPRLREDNFGRLYRAAIGAGALSVMPEHIAFPAFIRREYPTPESRPTAPPRSTSSKVLARWEELWNQMMAISCLQLTKDRVYVDSVLTKCIAKQRS